MKRPCVFFDRDGIVNASPGPARYVERLEDFHILPEFIEALALVRRRGYEAVLVTNQRGVSLGRMSLETVEALHRHLAEVVRAHGLALLDVRVCTADDPHDPRRKPNPGMLQEAMDTHGLDPARSWMIGDAERDVEAGRRAGCRTILVHGGNAPTTADMRVPDMRALVRALAQALPDFTDPASRASAG